MTSEIAILNRNAVALAADSAVTVNASLEDRTTQKIYNTTNKLFSLSKYHPVGIMVYGNANILDIPWEVIIKLYREDRKDESKDKISEYVDDFIDYLSSYFSNEQQEEFFMTHLSTFLHHFVKSKIDEREQRIIEDKGEITHEEIENIVDRSIKEGYKEVKDWEKLSYIPEDFGDELIVKYDDFINGSLKLVFGELPISESGFETIYELVVIAFTTKNLPQYASGVVISGFGDEEIFPCIQAFTTIGVINDVLIYSKELNRKIGEEYSSSINAFAQKEMISSFIEGIDPEYDRVITNFIDRIFEEFPYTLVDNVELDDDEKEDILESLTEKSKEIRAEIIESLLQYRRNKFVNPITTAVGFLPKDELAEMAESLVNLTSFKRKVTLGPETVGGPIDVAVISKGDGFIWIKRKHYFKPELNHHFFENYFDD